MIFAVAGVEYWSRIDLAAPRFKSRVALRSTRATLTAGGLSLMATNPLLNGLQPMHPGEMLREDVLPSLGRSKTEIASLLGISRQTLFDILRERQPVTPAMALRFGKLLGNGRTSGSIYSAPTTSTSLRSSSEKFLQRFRRLPQRSSLDEMRRAFDAPWEMF
jgi:addiction module HigA family antidote